MSETLNPQGRRPAVSKDNEARRAQADFSRLSKEHDLECRKQLHINQIDNGRSVWKCRDWVEVP